MEHLSGLKTQALTLLLEFKMKILIQLSDITQSDRLGDIKLIKLIQKAKLLLSKLRETFPSESAPK